MVDPGSVSGSGGSPGEGNGNPLQYSCLENPTDGGAWWATIRGVTKSRTRLSDFTLKGFPGGAVVKNLPANSGDTGSIPGLGGSPGEGNGNPFQCSCLGNPMDRRGCRATVHWVTKESNMT